MAVPDNKSRVRSSRVTPEAKAREKTQSGDSQMKEPQWKQSGTAGAGKKKVEIPASLKDLTETTSHVVMRAASILEEEIARGIIAAKEIEGKFLNVEKTRSRDPEEVIQRFRRDAHEVIDIFIDLVSAASTRAAQVARTTIITGGGSRAGKGETAAADKVPALTMPRPVKAGESSQVEMTLENDSDKATDKFGFYASDLLNADGDRIPASHVTFEPSSLVIGPKKSEKVTIIVKAPKGTPAGAYSGLIQATNLNQLRAVLEVRIQ